MKTLPEPTAGAAPPLDLLFDTVTFGLGAELAGFPAASLHAFAAHLTEARVLVARDRAGAASQAERLSLRVPIATPDGWVVGNASAVLVLAPSGPGSMRLTRRSALRLNPLRLLHTCRGAGACGERGLDGNTNLIGPFEDQTSDTLEEQLALVDAAVEAVADVLGAALPKGARVMAESLHLRAVEVCRDRRVGDAVAVARSLQRTMLSGAVTRLADVYLQGAADEKGVPAVRWKARDGGPAFKAYAKRPDLLRAEVACLDRAAVRAVLAGPGGQALPEISGDSAVGLLGAFADAARPLLDRVSQHVDEAGEPVASTAELLVSLRPLIELAAGARAGRGAPPQPETVAAARTVLTNLIEAGSTRTTGMRPSGALRRLLVALAGPSGPLRRGGSRGTVFTLHPRYAAAALAVARAGART